MKWIVSYWELTGPDECWDQFYATIDADTKEEALSKFKTDNRLARTILIKEKKWTL